MPEREDPDCKIWRYMDFPKLVWMLLNRALFFCRTDKLCDPFEGSLTKKAREHRTGQIRNSEAVRRAAYSQKELEDDSAFCGYHETKYAFVNCWHIGDHESDAMWKLYGSTAGAVAIQSTSLRLNRALKNGEPDHYGSVTIGCVTYCDYEQDDMPGDLLSKVMTKRKAFAHERELRAVIMHSPVAGTEVGEDTTYSDHEEVTVDLGTLVEAIHVSPLAGEWFRDFVEDMLRHYGQDVPVNQSSLAPDPMF